MTYGKNLGSLKGETGCRWGMKNICKLFDIEMQIRLSVHIFNN